MGHRSHVYVDENLATCELVAVGAGRAVVFTAVRPDAPGPNEDAALVAAVDDRRGILAVADGAGGQAAGDRASATAVERLDAALEDVNGASVREKVLSAFEQANAEVAALGMGACTTLAVVEVDGRSVRTYHVGDSLVLVVGQRGKRKLETISHSPTGYAVEAGMLGEQEALHHEERHLVSNLVGATDMRIEMSTPIELAERDTVLVASDGLSDNIHIDELVEMVRKGPLESVGERLAVVAADRMRTPRDTLPSKPDDLTFIVYRP